MLDVSWLRAEPNLTIAEVQYSRLDYMSRITVQVQLAVAIRFPRALVMSH